MSRHFVNEVNWAKGDEENNDRSGERTWSKHDLGGEVVIGRLEKAYGENEMVVIELKGEL
ncbi:hypothetical protein BDFG_07911 [Blastomyces dermatitidis ATCC 26199]|nr:hypothetical protein BDFG_07911 [Blastomyces dermatitidis ATCC 26199]